MKSILDVFFLSKDKLEKKNNRHSFMQQIKKEKPTKKTK